MCCPILRHGFALSKAEFWNGLCLRYGWTPSQLPSTCLCQKPLTIALALSCPFGGFPSIPHNEVRDVLASSLKRVAHNVSIAPHLQPITGERFQLRFTSTENQARLDVVASAVWVSRFERTFLDVRVFNPYIRHQIVPFLSSLVTTAGAMTGGSGRWSGHHFCRLFSLLP